MDGVSPSRGGAAPFWGCMARDSAFNGTNSAGVRCPWRFGNLNNGGNAGLAYENGNNTPSNSNWNSVPRIADTKGARMR